MPPMTPAEKQKKYRERLKSNNPEKYEEMRKKSSENALKYYRNKRDNYTPEQKEEQRRKWKEDREKSKSQIPSTSEGNSAVEEAVKLRNIQRRIEYKLKVENLELRNKVSNLSKGFKSLERKYNRQKKVIDNMNENLENLMIRVKRFEDSLKSDETKETIEKRPNIVEYTPRKKVDEFICENVPDIETPKKEVIKQKLLEFNVLTETLKQEMKKSSSSEKNTFKKILDNNLVKKYKQKSKFTTFLGLKSNLKQEKRVHNIRKSIELRNKIEEFYNRDDVTRATAGKKEYRTYKKVTRQIRYQLDTLKNLHQKYTTEVEKISFTTFKKYRPFYVLPPKIRNCETCACVKHSNMQFMVDALKKRGLLQNNKSLNDVTSEFVCDFKSKKCMYGECDICSEKKITKENCEEEEIEWCEWAIKEHEYGQGEKKKKIKRMTKTRKTGTLHYLINEFNSEMKKFKIHVYNFYHQFNQYKYSRENLTDKSAIIHIDFSENFTCKYHEEVQATHFIKDQITLHTGVLYVKNEKPISFCSISSNNEHCPEAIWAHLDPILKYIKSVYPNVTTLHFFSDGPTTQYRQKKNFYLFSKNVYEYAFENGTWSFFEAAHGKGAADGIGGAIKRKLDMKIAQGFDIPDAETAFKVLNTSDTEIKIFFIPKENITPLDVNILPIHGTMKIHQIMTEGKLKIMYRNLSCFCNGLNETCGCNSPIIHEFKTATGPDTNKTQSNKAKKRKTSGKENIDCRVKTRKTKKCRRVSSSSDNSTDMEIEYADSDVTCYMEEDSLNFDILDEEFIETKDSTEQAPFELDENTGFLKRVTDPNKKITVLSSITLKKAQSENNIVSFDNIAKIKKENDLKESDNKAKLNAEEDKYEKKKMTYTNENVNEKLQHAGNIDVTILAKIKNTQENTASYDLQQSNVFGKRETITEINTDIYNTNFTKNNSNILNNTTIKDTAELVKSKEIDKKYKVKPTEDRSGKNVNLKHREENLQTLEKENSQTSVKDIGNVSDSGTLAIKREENGTSENMQTEKRQEGKSGQDDNEESKEDKSEKGESEEREDKNGGDMGEEREEDKSRKNRSEERDKKGKDESEHRDRDENEGDKTEENMETDIILNINDSIIVRYYLKKTWKYYIGFIENIEVKEGEKYYKVIFLKTVKDLNSFKFIFQRKLDIDIVPSNSIVKKVNLTKASNGKSFYLEDNGDVVFFT